MKTQQDVSYYSVLEFRFAVFEEMIFHFPRAIPFLLSLCRRLDSEIWTVPVGVTVPMTAPQIPTSLLFILTFGEIATTRTPQWYQKLRQARRCRRTT